MDKPVGFVFLRVKDSSGFTLSQPFALVEVAKAAAAHLNMLTREQYDLVASCIHAEHVHRVYRVKRTMDDHPAAQHMGVPPAVKAALDDLTSFEALMVDLRVERLEPAAIHERMAALAAAEE